MKVLNDGISIETNAAKMVLATKNEARQFGQMDPDGAAEDCRVKH
jgi:hypothetical protein